MERKRIYSHLNGVTVGEVGGLGYTSLSMDTVSTVFSYSAAPGLSQLTTGSRLCGWAADTWHCAGVWTDYEFKTGGIRLRMSGGGRAQFMSMKHC